MIMDEKTTIETLNNEFKTKLVTSEDQYNSYDAEDDKYIVEVKTRYDYYKDKLIEAFKLYSNFHKAEVMGKQFLYVLTDPKGFYVYNITKLMPQIIEFKVVPIRCEATTMFGNKSKVTKYSYFLPEELAHIYRF